MSNSNKDKNEVVILEAVRTPIGTYNGSLKNLKADRLGTIVIREISYQALIFWSFLKNSSKLMPKIYALSDILARHGQRLPPFIQHLHR